MGNHRLQGLGAVVSVPLSPCSSWHRERCDGDLGGVKWAALAFQLKQLWTHFLFQVEEDCRAGDQVFHPGAITPGSVPGSPRACPQPAWRELQVLPPHLDALGTFNSASLKH